jgi:protein-S-isoprenylcysteine O-methyltransferase Ste14
MLIALLRWLTFAAFLSILLVYFKGGTTLYKDIRVSTKSTGSYQSALLLISMFVVGLFLVGSLLMMCLGYSQAFVWAEKEWLVTTGSFLALLSILGIYWFRFGYLRRFWSGSVQVQSSQEIIDVGPYRVIRHPIYSTALVMYPGIAMGFATWWIWLACGLLVIGYILVTDYEDRFLAANLPGYREYQERTRYRLIPGVW